MKEGDLLFFLLKGADGEDAWPPVTFFADFHFPESQWRRPPFKRAPCRPSEALRSNGRTFGLGGSGCAAAEVANQNPA